MQDAPVSIRIEDHLGQVAFLAKRLYSRTPPDVEYDDLYQEGVLGLMDAIKKYRHDRNVRFSTYAEWRIRGAMLDALRRWDWVSRSVRDRDRERADGDAYEAPVLCSLDTQVEVDGSLVSIVELIPAPPAPHQDSEWLDVLDRYHQVMTVVYDGETLTDVERRALIGKHVHGMTLRSMAKLAGQTESCWSHYHTRAVQKLRTKLTAASAA